MDEITCYVPKYHHTKNGAFIRSVTVIPLSHSTNYETDIKAIVMVPGGMETGTVKSSFVMIYNAVFNNEKN